MIRRLLLVPLVFVALPALNPARVAASFPGRDGTIVWAYTVSVGEGPTPERYAIVTVEPTGAATHRVRSCSTFGDSCKDWADVSYSPTGQQLAWDIQRRNGTRYVVVAGSHGRGAVTVGTGFDPSFAPSGRQLVYIRRLGGGEQIVATDLHGGHVRVLHNVRRASDPQVSPDGTQILFAQNSSVWLMGANGRDARSIIPGGKAPDWAPSGTELAYVGTKSGRVFTASADGSHRHELPADGLCYPPQCGEGGDFAVFSPDGQYIAFDDGDASEDPDIYTMPATGGPATLVESIGTDSAGGAVTGLAWQPLP